MGKKGGETIPEAYQRINYLYQVSTAFASLDTKSRLPAYYGHIAKEISKKIVGKLHPNVKRTLCSACSVPLQEETSTLRAKVVPYKQKKKKKRKTNVKVGRKNIVKFVSCDKIAAVDSLLTPEICNADGVLSSAAEEQKTVKRKCVPRVQVREKRVNEVAWKCDQCGFSRTLPQRPSHQLWVESQNYN